MTDRELMQQAAEMLQSQDMTHWSGAHDRVTITALRDRLARQEQEPVAFNQFLSDVMTAAGLVRGGKQSKALADRLGEGVMNYRIAPPPVQQKPVAWLWLKDGNPVNVFFSSADAKDDPWWRSKGFSAAPLYTAPPPARKWQGLTDEEIGLLTTGDGWAHLETPALALFARAIEAKLKERNA